MGLRNVIEDLREEEKVLHPSEIKKLFLGRYAFTYRIIKAGYVPEVDPEVPDLVFYRFQVVRRGLSGKLVVSNDSSSTNKPNQELVRELNDPDILLHASKTEQLARRAKAGLGLAALGAAYAFAKGTKAYKSHKHNQT